MSPSHRTWDRGDSERWLNDNPLPKDFEWNGELVQSSYRLRKGFGQWLRTSGSYHPPLRGLFAAVHDLLELKSRLRAPVPTPEQLAAELLAEKIRGENLDLPLGD